MNGHPGKLLNLLRTCVSSKLLIQGKVIHQKIITLGLQDDAAFCKTLMNFYFSCQNFNSAKLVFETVETPLDVSLWNGLMAGYAKNCMFIEALEIFGQLLQNPYLKPDCYTYPSVLKACAALGRVCFGEMIHTHLVRNGLLSDVVVVSSIVGMYAKCNAFEHAIQLFEEMAERDVACWNTVISCYYQSGKTEKALELFEKMRCSGFEPNSVTLTTVISACARLLDLGKGKEIHKEFIKQGFLSDDYVNSALVDMYGKCGCLRRAEEVFEQIATKNVIAWNSMIAGYASNGDSKSCINLFKKMSQEGIRPTLTTLTSILMACARSSELHHGKFIHGYLIRNRMETDTFINNTLIDLYFRCSRVQSAANVFKKMSKADVVSWNVMISGYVTVGSYFEALGIYDEMKEAGVKPDAITFSSVLPACSHLAALEKGKQIHESIIENKLERNEIVMGALLDMYAKCGDVNEALRTFYQLPQRDLVSWTTMITAYGSHGQALEALNLFGEMKRWNVKPDGITFLAVLSACSHGGFVDEGCYYFNQMSTEHGINPRIEHYSCLIDLLGRAGRLHEAYGILQQTPEIREDFGLLSTLFSACLSHRNYELGDKIARLVIEKDPDDPSNYIGLSNMYASMKRWDEVGKVRSKMRELGLRKNPGCSWIEIDKRIQAFFVEDQSHPEAETVYQCLTILSGHMEKELKNTILEVWQG